MVEKKAVKWKGVQCISLEKSKTKLGQNQYRRIREEETSNRKVHSKSGRGRSLSCSCIINLVVDDGLSDALNLFLDLSLCHASTLDSGGLV